MVPPIMVMAGSPAIERIGLQKTYVFYKNGIETFVIRPGYRGSIDDFGMLIPFPTPPAIRKVPDGIFGHVAAAIDPPEVIVYANARRDRAFQSIRGGVSVVDAMSESDLSMKRDAVVVLREEAVGMYEVAVLEAGSAAALQKWMDAHGYKYPDGMDDVCEEYVEDRWCFVAVKTKIGQKAGVNPRPGLRQVNPDLPDGATFNGNVQAMGFRFRTDEFVLPMRLSAFNEGELRNVVYILTDRAQRINDIPTDYVVRQVSGRELFKHVTKPLPVRVIGGQWGDIGKWQLDQLDAQRDPAPHNGHALELFASDLRTARTGKLAHEFEEMEKELLRIGERLGLRGADLDAFHHEALAEAREEALRGALEDIRRMTLTVVDGDFSRDVIARANLEFHNFAMRSSRNKASVYDAKHFGPAPEMQGRLYEQGAADTKDLWHYLFPVMGTLLLGVLLMGSGRAPSHQSARLRRTADASTRSRAFPVIVIAAAGMLAVSSLGAAGRTPAQQWIEQLGDVERVDDAVEALVAIGGGAVDPLIREVRDGDDITSRGWAIVCLAEIGGAEVEAELQRVYSDGNQEKLVRTWAAAARIQMIDSVSGLEQEVRWSHELPPITRPLGERFVELSTPAALECLIRVGTQNRALQKPLGGSIAAAGADRLVDVMLSAENREVRRGAAGYLGGLSAKGDAEVAEKIIDALRFRSRAKRVPWSGGPLFLPGLQWPADDARELSTQLMKWLVFCEHDHRGAEVQQILNNLRSWQLMQSAGYEWPQSHDAEGWLHMWGKKFGRQELVAMCAEQRVLYEQPFRRVLQDL
jgi:hypothetical protein